MVYVCENAKTGQKQSQSARVKTAAIIVAGGKGSRAGQDLPKQLCKLSGKPLFAWSLEACDHSPHIDEIILVTPPGQASAYSALTTTPLTIVAGGQTRTESVRAGLKACSISGDERVLIHDAARPGLNPFIIGALLKALDDCDAAAPALIVCDALKRDTMDGHLETIARDGVYRVQTPQVFRYDTIMRALSQGQTYVDDLAAIEALKGKVRLIEGHESLMKITYPEDFPRAERLLSPAKPPRIGTGYDVHAFEPGNGLTLCGVWLDHTAKLAGHSDADVAWHALTDAILGAVALGDIGDHFPPSDPQWKNASSEVFLRHAVELAQMAGWKLENCDITLICETPKIKPHRARMRQRTSEVTGLSVDMISIKATTTEGLGFTGRGEGIAAQAAALLSPLQNGA